VHVSRSKKRFKERRPAEQAAIAVLMTLSLMVVLAAECDIQRRPGDEVRGSKSLWRLVCLNAVGSALYFRWGRKPSVEVAHA
jgi:hypothetical protein